MDDDLKKFLEEVDKSIAESDELIAEIEKEREFEKLDKIEKVIITLKEKLSEEVGIEAYRVIHFPNSIHSKIIYYNYKDNIAIGYEEESGFIDIYGVTEEEFLRICKECKLSM